VQQSWYAHFGAETNCLMLSEYQSWMAYPAVSHYTDWDIDAVHPLTTRAQELASFPCKLNTFRKRVKNVVTSKGIQVGTECK